MNISFINVAIALVLALFSSLDVYAASPATQPLADKKTPPAVAMVVQETIRAADTGISVLERFKSHSGPRTPAALSALFTMPLPANIRQQPEIALSDGTTTVSIEAAVAAPKGTAPNFACIGARLISIKHNDADKWVIVMLPEKGSWNASLIMLNDSDKLEVPLAVAPMLPAGTDLSEQGFKTFLGIQGPKSQPLQDLNGDGKRDYLDDYIFTANYLVRQRSVASVPDTGQSSESQAPSTIQESVVQTPLDSAVTAPEPGEVPGAGPGIAPESAGNAIKPDTSPDRHNPANRNERARKMKDLLNPPGQ